MVRPVYLLEHSLAQLSLASQVPNGTSEGLALSFDSKNLNMTSVINITSHSVVELLVSGKG